MKIDINKQVSIIESRILIHLKFRIDRIGIPNTAPFFFSNNDIFSFASVAPTSTFPHHFHIYCTAICIRLTF
jgi:hypothetical protein